MDTKRAIELIEHVSWNAFGNYGYDNNREEMIALLQRGEKYEKMWGEFKTMNREYFSNFDTRANHIIKMEELEQKYFPKSVNKVITIEVEADNEDVLKGELNFIKAFFERNKDTLQCKYKVKEGD